MSFIASTLMGAMMGGGSGSDAGGSDPWAGMRTVTTPPNAFASIGSALGSSIMTLLEGRATMLSVSAELDAAEVQAQSLGLAADDAEEEANLEALKGIERRSSLKKLAHSIVGEQALAFAAGGQDLTFGSPVQARAEAFEELDAAISADNFTQSTRVSRLSERAGQYRKQAKTVRRGAKYTAQAKKLKFAANVIKRG
ncbi:MAG: hypothetical protein JKY94_09925 [Rhodobacteraceae bacterium]|nr:hypothetical protein [Paracoccaceae bacterium]